MPYRVEELDGGEIVIEHIATRRFIPQDPRNRDYQAYLAWKDAQETGGGANG